MESNGVYLPSDMVTEILLKLPVLSIIRFNCVSKTWYHLFHDSSFISRHLSVSKNNTIPLFQYYDSNTNSTIITSVLSDQTAVFNTDLPELFKGFSFSGFLTVVNGLVCLHGRNSRIIIWNPATRESRMLPEFDTSILGDGSKNLTALGFAFDPLSNDYKVICIRRAGRPLIAQYVVYQMSTDSWRVLKEEPDKFCIRSTHHYSTSTCVNGVLYWIVWIASEFNRSGSRENRILAFDFGTESFRLMQSPMPLAVPKPDRHTTVIGLRDNRLGFWDASIYELISYDLWVLNDDQESWTKLRTIEGCSNITEFYGFWYNGQIIVEDLNENILLYDLETDEFMETRFQVKIEKGLSLWYVYPYEETLVSINRKVTIS